MWRRKPDQWVRECMLVGASVDIDGTTCSWLAPCSRLMRCNWCREASPDVVREFMRLLAVCHTVIPEGIAEPSEIAYQVGLDFKGFLGFRSS
jgi:hypothetical protein